MTFGKLPKIYNCSTNPDICKSPPDWYDEDEYKPDEAAYDEAIDRILRSEKGD